MISFGRYGTSDISIVSDRIRRYWLDSYADGIHYSPEQIDRFYERGESPEIIASRMVEGCIYEDVLDNGVSVGLIAYQVIDGKLHVDKLYLDSVCRGKGYGRILMQRMVDYAVSSGCSSVFLETNVINENGIGFYTHLGFSIVGTYPIFLDDVQRGNMMSFEMKLQ